MDSKRLFKCIGLIEDKYLEEAENEELLSKKKKTGENTRSNFVKKACLIAACTILLISVGLWGKLYNHKSNTSNASKSVKGNHYNPILYLTDHDNKSVPEESMDQQDNEYTTCCDGTLAAGHAQAYDANGYGELYHIADYYLDYHNQEYHIVSLFENVILTENNLPSQIDENVIGKKIGTYDFILSEQNKKMEKVEIYQYKNNDHVLLIKDNVENWYYAISTN